MHRFVWDLRYERPATLTSSYPIAAIYRNTPREPRGMWVMPGRYTVLLTAGGKTVTQPLSVRMDPRVKTPRAALQQQFALSRRLSDMLRQDHDALTQLRGLRAQLRTTRERATQSGGSVSEAVRALDQRAAALEGQGGGFGGGAGGGQSLARLNTDLGALLNDVQEADAAPTAAMLAAASELQRTLTGLQARWTELRGKDVGTINEQLRQAGLPTLPR
jgi:hypothetical protein